MVKISVIIPVKNEESNVEKLLDALLSQTRLADEIIITDGGSTDKTPTIIEGYVKANNFIKLIRLPQAFPGKGRNTSIAHSSYNVIASIDAGCLPVKNWLEELVAPFDDDSQVDIVYGIYRPAPKTLSEKCFVLATEDIGFNPTVASMAYKKEVWVEVGGYPENLRASEDIIFKSKLEAGKFVAKYNPNALVYWQPRSNIMKFFKQLYNYSKSNGHLGLKTWFYIRKIVFNLILIFLITIGIVTYSIFILLAIILYTVWMSFTIFKHYVWFKNINTSPLAYIYLPVVFLTRDIAQIAGFSHGILTRIFQK